jgi:hypothetical protein
MTVLLLRLHTGEHELFEQRNASAAYLAVYQSLLQLLQTAAGDLESVFSQLV